MDIMDILKIEQQEITSKETALYQVPALHNYLAKNKTLAKNNRVLDFVTNVTKKPPIISQHYRPFLGIVPKLNALMVILSK